MSRKAVVENILTVFFLGGLAGAVLLAFSAFCIETAAEIGRLSGWEMARYTRQVDLALKLLPAAWLAFFTSIAAIVVSLFAIGDNQAPTKEKRQKEIET